MLKKIIICSILFLMLFQAVAFAAEGDVVFKDSIYGAIIGGLLGTAIYFADNQKDLGVKLGVGVAVGTAAGMVFGLAADNRSFATIENDKIAIAVPRVMISRTENGVKYSTSLLKYNF